MKLKSRHLGHLGHLLDPSPPSLLYHDLTVRVKERIQQADERYNLLLQMVVKKLIVGQEAFMLGYLW